MLFLPNTTTKLQLITSAAGDVGVMVSWVDLSGTTVTADGDLVRATTATTTDIVPAPAASTVRNIKDLKVGNNSASVTNTVTIQVTDGTLTFAIEQLTLAPGERMSYVEGVGIRAFDAAGREKFTTSGGSSGNANTADVTANAADTYLVGGALNIGGRIQAGSFFKWRLRATKTAAGTATPIFSFRVGTAGTTADTARTTITSAAQTAATDTAMIEVDAVFRSAGATAVMQTTLRLDHVNATTGFSTSQFQMLASTSASFDASNTANVLGLSVNPGASGVWTFQEVTVEANNLIG